jgi:aspartyl protease family protein
VGEEFARKARLPEGGTGYFSTANGTVEGKIVKDQVVQAEGFKVSGLSVAVTPLGGKAGLLGQNFLKRFEVSQSDGVMRLRLAP